MADDEMAMPIYRGKHRKMEKGGKDEEISKRRENLSLGQKW